MHIVHAHGLRRLRCRRVERELKLDARVELREIEFLIARFIVDYAPPFTALAHEGIDPVYDAAHIEYRVARLHAQRREEGFGLAEADLAARGAEGARGDMPRHRQAGIAHRFDHVPEPCALPRGIYYEPPALAIHHRGQYFFNYIKDFFIVELLPVEPAVHNEADEGFERGVIEGAQIRLLFAALVALLRAEAVLHEMTEGAFAESFEARSGAVKRARIELFRELPAERRFLRSAEAFFCHAFERLSLRGIRAEPREKLRRLLIPNARVYHSAQTPAERKEGRLLARARALLFDAVRLRYLGEYALY